jgi:hypothetical protein
MLFRGGIRRAYVSSIVTSYGLDDWGWIAGRGRNFISAPIVVYRLWGPQGILFSGYYRLFRGWSTKLITHHTVSRCLYTQL